jgi:choline dehydrogenase
VILAAGSIGSPQILQLSGIGPPTCCSPTASAVVHALAGVGANLHDHLQIRMVWKVKGPTLNERANSLDRQGAMGLEYLLFKTGPLTMPPSQLGAFAKSDPAEPAPDMEWHVQPLSLDKFGEPLHPFPAITPSVCNLRPTSRGHVRDQGRDPMAAPGDPAELPRPPTPTGACAAKGDALHAAHHGRARRWPATAPRSGGRAGREDDADLVRAAGDLGTTIFHPVGTCAMGPGTAPWWTTAACARNRGPARYRCIVMPGSRRATPTRRPI